jgi:hypothetical protein
MHIGIILLAMLLEPPHDIPIHTKERCSVLSTGDPSRYIFVKIYEVSSGKIVFQSTLRGGQSKGIFVGSNKIRIERKGAGDIDYHSGIVVDCENGNTISI